MFIKIWPSADFSLS